MSSLVARDTQDVAIENGIPAAVHMPAAQRRFVLEHLTLLS